MITHVRPSCLATEALGVDVTSETERRYAIRFGIQDPADGSTAAGSDAATQAERDEGPADASVAGSGTVEDSAATGSAADTPDADGTNDDQQNDPGTASVGEAFTSAGRESSEEFPIADGFGSRRS